MNYLILLLAWVLCAVLSIEVERRIDEKRSWIPFYFHLLAGPLALVLLICFAVKRLEERQ